MNYAQARQRKDDGLWDWTVMRDKQIRQASPCSDECHHVTQEEADRHFYEWCLSQVQEYEDTETQHKCAVCGAWTNRYFENRPMGHLNFMSYLCDAHRNLDELRKLHPFESGIALIYS